MDQQRPAVYVVPKVAPCEHCGGGAVVAFKCSSCGGFQRAAFKASRVRSAARRALREKRAACAHEEWERESVSYPAGAGVETQRCTNCGERRYLEVA